MTYQLLLQQWKRGAEKSNWMNVQKRASPWREHENVILCYLEWVHWTYETENPNIAKIVQDDSDSNSLFKVLRNQAFYFRSQYDLAQVLFEATNRLQTIVQDQNMSFQEHIDQFQSAVDVVIQIARFVPVYPSLVDAVLKGKNLERDKATKN